MGRKLRSLEEPEVIQVCHDFQNHNKTFVTQVPFGKRYFPGQPSCKDERLFAKPTSPDKHMDFYRPLKCCDCVSENKRG